MHIMKEPPKHCFRGLCECGTNGNRTSDTRIFSPLLYQLSYGTNFILLLSASHLLSYLLPDCECKGSGFFLFCKHFGNIFSLYFLLPTQIQEKQRFICRNIFKKYSCTNNKKRKGEPLIWFTFCAQDETRTHTTLLPLPPQSSVYTNFTTCAYTFQEINFERKTRLELATPTLARLCSTN